MGTSDEVLFHIKDRVATITINRPQKRNSISGKGGNPITLTSFISHMT